MDGWIPALKWFGVKKVPAIWANTQELNHGHKLLKGVFLFKPMEFSTNFDTVKSGWSTINIERSAYNFLKYIAFLYLKIDFVLAYSENPYEMPHYAAFYLGLQC